MPRFFRLSLMLCTIMLLLCACAPAIPQMPEPPRTTAAAPEPTPEPTPVSTPSPTPEPTPSPEPTWAHPWPQINLSLWQYRLVNPWHALPDDFAPQITQLPSGAYFDVRAADALEAFVAAGNAEGISMFVSSGYRDMATQRYLYERKVKSKTDQGFSRGEAEAYARRIVAYPGTSEHNLGLAADIVDQRYDLLTSAFADTAAGQWLRTHCAEYGFILRYPQGKEEITGIIYEPWHFRYVGKEAAAYIMENGICYEEFLALYEEAE